MVWLVVLCSLLIACLGWRFLDRKYHLAADISFLAGAGGKMLKVIRSLKEPGASIVQLWYSTFNRPAQAEKDMLISAEDGRSLTFGDVEALSNQIGNWSLSRGWKFGDRVAVVMGNCPEYVALWLGFAKAGAATALINANSRAKALVHAVAAVEPSAVIFGQKHIQQGAEVAQELRQSGGEAATVLLVSFSPRDCVRQKVDCGFCDCSLDDEIAVMPSVPIAASVREQLTVSSPCCFVYTSGTTGLPKACVMSHARMMAAGGILLAFLCTEDDIIYGSGLPLYHSAANIGVSMCMAKGSTLVLREKFSASSHWDDCVKYRATVMQYIGELCRYLLAAAEKQCERAHSLRIAVGNGLRPEIWNQFQRRFHIAEIGEYYAATEGNTGLLNHCRNYQGQGAVGRGGAIWKRIKPYAIVKLDVDTEMPLRDPQTGFCIPCAQNEPGELLSLIKKVKMASGTFDDYSGYTSGDATEKKIIRGAFQKGDSYFRTGDLLRQDQDGYFYFVDRIGDTFRWKGENVSTMEVSEAISVFSGVVDATVYGVQVPKIDGRAGMVALTLQQDVVFDPNQFASHCLRQLPLYATPVFVRLLSSQIDLTSTFKHKKGEYRSQGCDPDKVGDPMWWLDTSAGCYVPYRSADFAALSAGKVKI